MPEEKEDYWELERLRKKALEETSYYGPNDSARKRDEVRMQLKPSLGTPTLTPRWHDDWKFGTAD